MRRRVQIIVKEEESGLPVLDFLVKCYRFKDAAQWLAVLCEEQVLLNGAPAEVTAILKRGDEVQYEAPEAPEPRVDRNISIIYEDEYLVVVNKTGNLPCHPSGCYLENTLLNILQKHTGMECLHLINRLDRETSGVILVAKNAEIAKKLSQQFLKRRAEKLYSVIVEGEFPDALHACGWLMHATGSVVRKKRAFVAGAPHEPPAADAEWAETLFERVQSDGVISLVNVTLMTGRLHQIRATLCSLGFPVVGDKIYGVDDNLFLKFITDQITTEELKILRLPRQALHARELGISHPVTGEPLVFKASLPPEMRALFEGDHSEPIVP